jgi:hypothetical protein
MPPDVSSHHAAPAWYARPGQPADAGRVAWVDKAELRAELARHRATGAVSGRLAGLLADIARGVWRKARPTDDEDDFAQDAVLHLAYGAPLRRVDPADPRALAFLIRCCHSFAHKQRVKQIKAVARRDAVLAHAADLARPAVRLCDRQAGKLDA